MYDEEHTDTHKEVHRSPEKEGILLVLVDLIEIHLSPSFQAGISTML